MQGQNNRNFEVDLLKTISIIGVVFIHGSWLLCSSIVNHILGNMFRFCVPVFIVMWAFFYEAGYGQRSGNDLREYSKSRLLHLLRVFSTWSLIYFFIIVDWHTITPKNLISKYWSGFGWSGQFFFIVLFQLHILFPILRKLYQSFLARVITIFLISMIYIFWGYWHNSLPDLILKLDDRPFIFWIPYVFLGLMLARNENKRFSWLFCLLLILIPIEFAIYNWSGLKHSPYVTPGILIASSALALPFLSAKSSQNYKKIPRWLSFLVRCIGANTMTIFVANPLIIKILSLFLHPKSYASCRFLAEAFLPFISTGLIVAICMMVAFIINRTKLKGILN
jgi:hypothetical protein